MVQKCHLSGDFSLILIRGAASHPQLRRYGRWIFRAVNAGDTTVVLGYYPSSNFNDPEEVVTFSIHVE